jgi:hypothetical protein
MIILSLNCIGLANPSKKLSLKRLIDVHSPSIMFLQETMMDEDRATKILSLVLLGWEFKFIDSQVHSRGIILGWKISFFLIKNTWTV